MSTVKSVRTLAIIFAFLIGIKHEVGCLRRTTEEFQQPGIELRKIRVPLGDTAGAASSVLDKLERCSAARGDRPRQARDPPAHCYWKSTRRCWRRLGRLPERDQA